MITIEFPHRSQLSRQRDQTLALHIEWRDGLDRVRGTRDKKEFFAADLVGNGIGVGEIDV